MILYSHSFRSFEDIASSELEEFSEVPGMSEEKPAAVHAKAREAVERGVSTQEMIAEIIKVEEEERVKREAIEAEARAEAEAAAAIEAAAEAEAKAQEEAAAAAEAPSEEPKEEGVDASENPKEEGVDASEAEAAGGEESAAAAEEIKDEE